MTPSPHDPSDPPDADRPATASGKDVPPLGEQQPRRHAAKVPKPCDPQTLRRALQTELDAAYLYGLLATLEVDDTMADIFRQLSAIERQHARALLAECQARQAAGPHLPNGPSRRARLLGWLGKRVGPAIILATMSEIETAIGAARRRLQRSSGRPFSAGHENPHAVILAAVNKHAPEGLDGGLLARLEGRHRNVGGNALRAAVLGANDGLVSNLSLVMGVSGADVDNRGILIAGMAGLLAGSISMALGEWLSVQSSRELYEHHITIEAAELESEPELEQQELALIYRAKGLPPEQAERLAAQLMENPQSALDTMAREELGVDPEELGGSAWEAAFSSFFLFALGAIIPVVPFLLTTGMQAVLFSLLVSAVGLFAIGAAITLLTGRSVWYSGMRQLLFGLTAAAVTYGIGYLLGVSVSG